MSAALASKIALVILAIPLWVVLYVYFPGILRRGSVDKTAPLLRACIGSYVPVLIFAQAYIYRTANPVERLYGPNFLRCVYLIESLGALALIFRAAYMARAEQRK